MPLVRIKTTIDIETEKKASLMSQISTAVAELLGKPESYMMIIVEDGLTMQMSGTPDPNAFIEIRSVGKITEEQAKNLSGKISEVVGKTIGVGAGRIYLNFMGIPGEFWGFDGRTFG